MCQLEVVIYIENWSILVLSLLGTALDNRVSQKLLGNPDYCSGATDPSFIDNCAKPINVLSQGASFDPQPEFYQQKRESMIFHYYFQQPIFLMKYQGQGILPCYKPNLLYPLPWQCLKLTGNENNFTVSINSL